MRALCFIAVVLCAASLGAEMQNVVRVEKDFASDFDAGLVKNSSAAEASQTERSGKVPIPGIFLHPQLLDDAVVAYPKTAIPAVENTQRPFLVFRMGLRDGIPWETATAPPNGVRFLVAVDEQVVFSEEHAGVGWQARAVDMTSWAGKEVAVELRTNAIDGNSSYDWAVFGEPLLVTLPDAAEVDAGVAGLALAEVNCTGAASVWLTSGDVKQSAILTSGTHWIPLDFKEYKPVQLSVVMGMATLGKVIAAAYSSRMEAVSLELTWPLITVDNAFGVIYKTRNIGRGRYAGGDVFALEGLPSRVFDSAFTAPRTLGQTEPGKITEVRWSGLVAKEPGDYVMKANGVSLPFHVFPAHAPDSIVIGNKWCRLTFVNDNGNAYALSELWNGEKWQRGGSLYPLVSAALSGTLVNLKVESFEPGPQRLTVHAADARCGLAAKVTFTVAEEAPRVAVNAELVTTGDCRLLAFSGPVFVVAGKDFAIFPGLEYLEGNEGSSSERDLAPPLNDRHVPAAYKIATPLMAVQTRDTLAALLWDENQEWAPGEKYPAAYFNAPEGGGSKYVHMSLFAPSVGKYVKENSYIADKEPYAFKKGTTVRLASTLVIDNKARYPKDSIVHGPHKGGLVLQAMAHWFDVFGFPEPSKQPRDWDAERALCRDAYLHAVWTEDPPGWSHCAGWKGGLHTGYCVPLQMDLQAGVSEPDRSEVQRRIDAVINTAIEKQGKHYLWNNAGCHILCAELPFTQGYLGEALNDFKRNGFAMLSSREKGYWVWRPNSEQTAELGKSGDHTLGQAAFPSFMALRAARMTGDADLASKALEAMKQMERYEVPRGAQVWECPLRQPDILAAAQAVRAYCEAYRLTGDKWYIDQARYWAWTGLPFLYTWELEGYPTMRYNVISVIGSTFYTHSWLGLPVVWCGLVYAYALQDLAEFDSSFDWRSVAQGITNSAMWQQYTEGPSKGTYPDSWNMVINKPNPADINPENIYVNEFRLRGISPEIRSARFTRDEKTILLNSAADIFVDGENKKDGPIRFKLQTGTEREVYSVLAPASEPTVVIGAGERVADSDALRVIPAGWLYDANLNGIVFKQRVGVGGISCEMNW